MVEAFLVAHDARFEGINFQQDTYIKVPVGRLKLRQGNIENNLIFYKSNDRKGPKQSDFQLVKVQDGVELKELLGNASGVKVVLTKKEKSIFVTMSRSISMKCRYSAILLKLRPVISSILVYPPKN